MKLNTIENIDPRNYIANYEMNNYSYGAFWKGREYEHGAELNLLTFLFKKYLPDLGKRRIVDIGGAYGRLAPLYAHTAKETIIADYSTKELLSGLTGLKGTYGKNIKYLALNAYKMPFKDRSIDSVLSVRVMHHLKDTDIFFKELYRVLSPGGVAIIEFAHKDHIVALFRALLSFKLLSFLKKKRIAVSHKSEASQGIQEGQVAIMYNFSVKSIKRIAKDMGFEVKGVYACSFFRSTLLKRFLKAPFLLKVEKIMQKFFGWLKITPSIFIVLRRPGIFTTKKQSFENILGCPICGKDFTKSTEKYVCKSKHVFKQKIKDIIDLRDPPPEDVTF